MDCFLADQSGALAGSFSGGEIVTPGSGYVSGDICLQGNISGGFGFSGTFDADPNNGSVVSINIAAHGVNYAEDPTIIQLCYSGSKQKQVVSLWRYFAAIFALVFQYSTYLLFFTGEKYNQYKGCCRSQRHVSKYLILLL